MTYWPRGKVVVDIRLLFPRSFEGLITRALQIRKNADMYKYPPKGPFGWSLKSTIAKAVIWCRQVSALTPMIALIAAPYHRYGLSQIGCWQYLACMNWLMYGRLFLHLSISLGSFRSRTFFYGLDKLPWPYFIPDLHAKLRITRTTRTPAFRGYPRRLMITHTIE